MRFDPVTVRIDDECRVIAGPVLLALAGAAVVLAAVRERGAIERVDLDRRRCLE